VYDTQRGDTSTASGQAVSGQADVTWRGPWSSPRAARPGDDMERLDRALAARGIREKVGCTIPVADRDRADAIARRHGYELRTHRVEEPDCVWAVFWPVAEAG
jgi:hypothetical protein